MALRAVFFDVGETLIDETRIWAAWAEWLGVQTLTLFGVLGGMIERGQSHLRAMSLVRPGFDLGLERAFIRRGPWGHLHAERPKTSVAEVRIDTLAELPARLLARRFSGG